MPGTHKRGQPLGARFGLPRSNSPEHAESLDLARQLGNREEEARQLGNLAEVRLALGDRDAAIELNRKALAVDEEFDNREGQARHAGNLGELYARQGKLETAEAMFRRALGLDERLGNRFGQARHHANLGSLLEQLNRPLTDVRRHHFNALALFREVERPVEAAESVIALSQLYRKTGETADARRTVQMALDLAPSHAKADQWRALLQELC